MPRKTFPQLRVIHFQTTVETLDILSKKSRWKDGYFIVLIHWTMVYWTPNVCQASFQLLGAAKNKTKILILTESSFLLEKVSKVYGVWMRNIPQKFLYLKTWPSRSEWRSLSGGVAGSNFQQEDGLWLLGERDRRPKGLEKLADHLLVNNEVVLGRWGLDTDWGESFPLPGVRCL